MESRFLGNVLAVGKYLQVCFVHKAKQVPHWSLPYNFQKHHSFCSDPSCAHLKWCQQMGIKTVYKPWKIYRFSFSAMKTWWGNFQPVASQGKKKLTEKFLFQVLTDKTATCICWIRNQVTTLRSKSFAIATEMSQWLVKLTSGRSIKVHNNKNF